MKHIALIIKNENGTVLIAAILILALLTILGVTGINTSSTEQSIAVNEEIYKMTFYAAEAGRTYVVANDGQDLWGRNNITKNSPVSFPLSPTPADATINSDMSFDGEVEYLGAFPMPRGAGYEHAKFKSHRYKMTSNGHGPRGTQVTVEAGFYRVGF